MNRKFLIGLLAILLGVIGITLVLSSENALVVHPKGVIAEKELSLIVVNILLMLVIIVPTYIFLFWIVYKYCLKGGNISEGSDYTKSTLGQIALWILPALVVLVMSIITWDATHELNPYEPLKSDVKALTVEVVAIDWKWLFIYPDLGIATLNYFHIPEKTPIHLKLTADASPMNSFWIPQLSGQIYSMTGMTTQLNLMANAVGEYTGRAVEINGEGYADMTFPAKSSSQKDFDEWVKQVKKSPLHLTEEAYGVLVKPSINKSQLLYSEVDPDLFHKIVHKYMYPAKPVL